VDGNDVLGVHEVAGEAVRRARAGTAAPDDLRGSTFTITNSERMINAMRGIEHQTGLAGQVALVTGGGRGIGRAVAATLAAAGAAVAVVARSEDQLAETVAQISRDGGHALALPVDVTDRRAIEQMATEVEQRLGPVDLLVNNAAVFSPPGPVCETDPDVWWHAVEVNLRGPYLCSRAVLPGMIARHNGRIINVSSGAGLRPIAYWTAYTMTKAALLRLSETMALETAEHGVSVFSVDPGTVRTAMSSYTLESAEGQKWSPWFRDIFDEGRDVPVERPAQLVLSIALGHADALSGRFIRVSDDMSGMLKRVGDDNSDDLYTLRLCT